MVEKKVIFAFTKHNKILYTKYLLPRVIEKSGELRVDRKFVTVD